MTEDVRLEALKIAAALWGTIPSGEFGSDHARGVIGIAICFEAYIIDGFGAAMAIVENRQDMIVPLPPRAV